MTTGAAFGPWADGLDRGERTARLRVMRGLALVFARRETAFIDALARAENDAAALARALELLERLPSLPKRKLLATYLDLARPPR